MIKFFLNLNLLAQNWSRRRAHSFLFFSFTTPYWKDTHLNYYHYLWIGNSTREDLDKLELASQDQTGFSKVLKPCKNTPELSAECICRVEVCLSWYPCHLKLCQGEDDNGQLTEYRCGIKTCGKCYEFDFYVGERRQCFWDTN